MNGKDFTGKHLQRKRIHLQPSFDQKLTVRVSDKG
jgi:hypothetical protein